MSHRISNIKLVLLVALAVAASCVAVIAEEEIEAARADWPEYQGRMIHRIKFIGDYRLREYILRREIDSRAGEPFDSALVERDCKKISGLGIFSRVDATVQEKSDSLELVFDLKEVWTLLPLLSISHSEDGFDWLVGISEKNLLGFYLRGSVFYRRFEGENSYGCSATFPRAFGKDLLLGWSLGDSREIDQLRSYDQEDSSLVEADYKYLNRYLSLNLGVRVSEAVYLSAVLAYNRENWTLLEEESLPPGSRDVYDFPRYSIGAGINLGRIYYDHYFYEGVDLTLALSLIDEKPGWDFSRWRIGMTGRAYYPAGDFNFAVRGQYLTSSADERVLPYYVSGRSNVRGYADKIERGDHFLGGNAEIRWRSLETGTFYTQVVAFLDAGTVWGRFHEFSAAIEDPYISVGGGLRLAIKQFLGNIGRADVAVNTKTGEVEYYLSAHQFF